MREGAAWQLGGSWAAGDASCPLPPAPPCPSLSLCPQYDPFVSWDSVWVAADILLSSMGGGHASQIPSFLAAWQKGAQA